MSAPEIRPRETVIMAVDFPALVAWYQSALGFELEALHEDDYHYATLKTTSGIKIGIADAKEMGCEPKERKDNTVLMQFEVPDVKAFFEHLEANGASIPFGPSYDKKGEFWYGGFADPEGNPFWVVDVNCV